MRTQNVRSECEGGWGDSVHHWSEPCNQQVCSGWRQGHWGKGWWIIQPSEVGVGMYLLPRTRLYDHHDTVFTHQYRRAKDNSSDICLLFRISACFALTFIKLRKWNRFLLIRLYLWFFVKYSQYNFQMPERFLRKRYNWRFPTLSLLSLAREYQDDRNDDKRLSMHLHRYKAEPARLQVPYLLQDMWVK